MLRAEDVVWIVNDAAELGVKIDGQCFFLYKGRSMVYPASAEESAGDEGAVRFYREVGKREFGECCHPLAMVEKGIIRRYDPQNPDDGMHYGITSETINRPEMIGTPIPGGGWLPLPGFKGEGK